MGTIIFGSFFGFFLSKSMRTYCIHLPFNKILINSSDLVLRNLPYGSFLGKLIFFFLVNIQFNTLVNKIFFLLLISVMF